MRTRAVCCPAGARAKVQRSGCQPRGAARSESQPLIPVGSSWWQPVPWHRLPLPLRQYHAHSDSVGNTGTAPPPQARSGPSSSELAQTSESQRGPARRSARVGGAAAGGRPFTFGRKRPGPGGRTGGDRRPLRGCAGRGRHRAERGTTPPARLRYWIHIMAARSQRSATVSNCVIREGGMAPPRGGRTPRSFACRVDHRSPVVGV